MFVQVAPARSALVMAHVVMVSTGRASVRATQIPFTAFGLGLPAISAKQDTTVCLVQPSASARRRVHAAMVCLAMALASVSKGGFHRTAISVTPSSKRARTQLRVLALLA